MSKALTETSSYTIHQMPPTERPRERLLQHGAEAIATSELLAIIMGSGMKGKSVLQLSQDLIAHFGTLEGLAEATVEELCQVKGLGQVKALQIKAAFNLGLRLSRQIPNVKYRIQHPTHVYHLVKDELEKEQRELFMVVLQDARGCVICRQLVAIGTLTQALVHPREVFYPAIRHKAVSLILVHNHPSGDPTPSSEDYKVTQSLIETGRLLGIPVHDHIIVGLNAYVSLREKGLQF